MKGEQERDELLRRLALGETSAEDADALAELERSDELRGDWERLAGVQERLAAAGREERDGLMGEYEQTSASDLQLAESFFRPQFEGLARARGSGSLLRPRWLAAAAAVLLVGVFLWWPRADEAPPEAWIATMSSWTEDVDLEALPATANPDGTWTLRWQHLTQKSTGTLYHLTLYDPADGTVLLEEPELLAAEWSAALDPEWPGEILWRVVAVDAEDVEYAGCHDVLQRDP